MLPVVFFAALPWLSMWVTFRAGGGFGAIVGDFRGEGTKKLLAINSLVETCDQTTVLGFLFRCFFYFVAW